MSQPELFEYVHQGLLFFTLVVCWRLLDQQNQQTPNRPPKQKYPELMLRYVKKKPNGIMLNYSILWLTFPLFIPFWLLKSLQWRCAPLPGSPSWAWRSNKVTKSPTACRFTLQESNAPTQHSRNKSTQFVSLYNSIYIYINFYVYL